MQTFCQKKISSGFAAAPVQIPACVGPLLSVSFSVPLKGQPCQDHLQEPHRVHPQVRVDQKCQAYQAFYPTDRCDSVEEKKLTVWSVIFVNHGVTEPREPGHWTAGDGAYATWKKIKAEYENGSCRRREGEAIKKSDSNKGTMGDTLFSSDESFFHLSVSQLFFLLRENMNICVCCESVNNGRPHKDLLMCAHTEAHRQTHTHICPVGWVTSCLL